MGPDIDHIIDGLPGAGEIHILIRDVGRDYDHHEYEVAASHSRDYLERLCDHLRTAEVQAQMADAIEAWREDLVENRGVPRGIAETLPVPSMSVLRDGFEFFASRWTIRAVTVIDAEKAIRREAMHARAAALDAAGAAALEA